MTPDQLLHELFPRDRVLEDAREDYFCGTAVVAGETVRFIGTANATEIGVALVLAVAAAVLDTIHQHPGRTIVLLLDTEGQRLRRREELLGLNGYMAHLAKCLEIARSRGHRIVSLVYGHAVSGGYLTTGMMADAAYALADAEIKVMNLPAMARITRIPLERLKALSVDSPVFSPGVQNYYRMGHLDGIWKSGLGAHLEAAVAGLRGMPQVDRRMERGRERGGRTSALDVAERVQQHE